MDSNAVTFGLAGAGYIMLAKDTALRLSGRSWAFLAWLTAAVVLAHVTLVWAVRFEWSLADAWQKSPPGFVVFHAALLLILAAPFVSGVTRDRVTIAAFGVVSAGALPAAFRYPEASVLAIPLLAAFFAVVAVVASTWRSRLQLDK